MGWASSASENCLLSTDRHSLAILIPAVILTGSAESSGAAQACTSVQHESGNGSAILQRPRDFLEKGWASGASEVCLQSTDLQASAACCGDCPGRSAKGAARRGCAAPGCSRSADSSPECLR